MADFQNCLVLKLVRFLEINQIPCFVLQGIRDPLRILKIHLRSLLLKAGAETFSFSLKARIQALLCCPTAQLMLPFAL